MTILDTIQEATGQYDPDSGSGSSDGFYPIRGPDGMLGTDDDPVAPVENPEEIFNPIIGGPDGVVGTPDDPDESEYTTPPDETGDTGGGTDSVEYIDEAQQRMQDMINPLPGLMPDNGGNGGNSGGSGGSGDMPQIPGFFELLTQGSSQGAQTALMPFTEAFETLTGFGPINGGNSGNNGDAGLGLIGKIGIIAVAMATLPVLIKQLGSGKQ